MADDGVWQVRAFTLMPDHLHLVVALGERLSLSQAVGRLKGKTAAVLCARNARWQDNFFDRRLDERDAILPVLLYIYLNPYRRGLIGGAEQWTWFYCDPGDWNWFRLHLNDDLPQPEWLKR